MPDSPPPRRLSSYIDLSRPSLSVCLIEYSIHLEWSVCKISRVSWPREAAQPVVSIASRRASYQRAAMSTLCSPTVLIRVPMPTLKAPLPMEVNKASERVISS